MANKNKLSKDLEEQIQSLAGDIYIQIEDKIANLLANIEQYQPVEEQVVDELQVKQHQIYQALLSEKNAIEEQHQKLVSDSSHSELQHNEQISSLNKQLDSSKDELNNLNKLNQAKLTDTEQALKDKLAEFSSTEKQLQTLINDKQQLNEKVVKIETELAQHIEEKNQLTAKEQNLVKSDRAKTATLEIQNQQISELNKKLNEAQSALEHFQAEQSQIANNSSDALKISHDKNTELTKEISALKNQIKSEQESVKLAEKTASEYHDKITELQSNIAKLSDEQTSQIKKYNDKDQEVTKLSKSLSEANSKINELTKSYDEKLKKQEAAHNQLTLNLSAEQQNNQSLAEELKSVKIDLSKQIESLEKANNALSEQQNKHIEQNKTQSTLLAEKEKTLGLAETKLQEQKALITTYEKQIEARKIQIEQISEKMAVAEHAYQLDKDRIIELEERLAKEESELVGQITSLKSELSALSENLKTEQNNASHLQQELSHSEARYKDAKQEEERLNLRLEAFKEKQEEDHDKARDTIKYLRDENFALAAKHDEELNNLEDKVREFRLKFEYAQKQLSELQ